MEERFTIEEIRKYIESQDSMGDILYNLSREKIIEVNGIVENNVVTVHHSYEGTPDSSMFKIDLDEMIAFDKNKFEMQFYEKFIAGIEIGHLYFDCERSLEYEDSEEEEVMDFDASHFLYNFQTEKPASDKMIEVIEG